MTPIFRCRLLSISPTRSYDPVRIISNDPVLRCLIVSELLVGSRF